MLQDAYAKLVLIYTINITNGDILSHKRVKNRFNLWSWDNNVLEIILLSGSTLLILLVELLNTAIETTLDRIGTEENDLTKYAKDMGSGAVLISLLLWLITWSLIVIY